MWNTARGRWSDLWRYEGESLYYRDADKELTDWRGRFEWLGAQPSVPQQQVLRDLYRSIGAFLTRPTRPGAPGSSPARPAMPPPAGPATGSPCLAAEWASPTPTASLWLSPAAVSACGWCGRGLRPHRSREARGQEHVGQGQGPGQDGPEPLDSRRRLGAFRATLAWQATKAGKTVVLLPARDTTQKCSSCGAKAKPRIELSDRVFACRCCGLVLGRDRNAARNLNPDRHGVPAGGTETAGTAVPEGSDGSKTKDPKGVLAA